MQTKHVRWITGALITGAVTLSAGTAFAGHDHYVVTPNGNCHQVAKGQTAINDSNHGGYHQFHVHVHFGATGGDGLPPHELGDGHSKVAVYKDNCPA